MHRAFAMVLLVGAVACGGAGSSGQPSTVARPIRGPADRITEQEINAGVYQNALEVIRNLRPSMTIPRGTSTSPVLVVAYMDDVRLGSPDALSTIPANRIKEIRYVNARDATTRYGTGHGSGAILVVTKR